MSQHRSDPAHALTLDDYRRLEAEGKITRPLTDAPIGRYTAAKRDLDARNSEIVTQHLELRPASKPRTAPDPAVFAQERRNRPWGTRTARHLEIVKETNA